MGFGTNDRYAYAVVETDTSGVVEWITNAGEAGMTVDIVAYIK